MTDFTLIFDGSKLYVLTPNTVEACQWADAHLPDDGPFLGNGQVIEDRYVADIIEGIVAADLSIA